MDQYTKKLSTLKPPQMILIVLVILLTILCTLRARFEHPPSPSAHATCNSGGEVVAEEMGEVRKEKQEQNKLAGLGRMSISFF